MLQLTFESEESPLSGFKSMVALGNASVKTTTIVNELSFYYKLTPLTVDVRGFKCNNM